MQRIVPSHTNALVGTARKGSIYTEQQHAKFEQLGKPIGEAKVYHFPVMFGDKPGTVACPVVTWLRGGRVRISLPAGDVVNVKVQRQ